MAKVNLAPHFLAIGWVGCVLMAFLAGRAARSHSWLGRLIPLQHDAFSEPLLPRPFLSSSSVCQASLNDAGSETEVGALRFQGSRTLGSPKQRAEALVHPALLTHEHPKRVAVLGEDVGLLVEEILKHRTVEHVEAFVPPCCCQGRSLESRVLYTLAEKLDLPQTLRHRARSNGPFDVIVWSRYVAIHSQQADFICSVLAKLNATHHVSPHLEAPEAS